MSQYIFQEKGEKKMDEENDLNDDSDIVKDVIVLNKLKSSNNRLHLKKKSG